MTNYLVKRWAEIDRAIERIKALAEEADDLCDPVTPRESLAQVLGSICTEAAHAIETLACIGGFEDSRRG